MTEVKWIKIVTDIFDDEKILLIESLPEADTLIVIWFKLLCLSGKQNNSGVFMINDKIVYTDEIFATIFRRQISTVRLALKTFENFGMIEIINNVITIPNWGKHQNFDKIEKNNEYQKNYMREYRDKQKLLTAETSCNTNSKPNCKPNCKPNVRALEENRIEKNRIEEININKEEEEIIKKVSKKVEAKETFDSIIDNYTKNPNLRFELKEHLKTRKAKKATLTNHAIKLSLEKLDTIADNELEKISIVKKAIMNGWTAFYELNDKDKEHLFNNSKKDIEDTKVINEIDCMNDEEFDEDLLFNKLYAVTK